MKWRRLFSWKEATLRGAWRSTFDARGRARIGREEKRRGRRYNACSIRVVFFRVGRRRSLVVVDGVEFLFIRLGVVEIGHLFRRRRHLRFFVLAAA